MLSFCLRVLNMSHDFIINYSIFGKKLDNRKYDFLLQMDWINIDFGAPMRDVTRM